MTEKKYTKIYFRIFPMEKMIWDYLKILDDHRTIYIRCLQQLAKSKENVVPTFWTFRTDHVFFNHTQKQIYDNVLPEVLDNIAQGNDAIVMAYGQTGTGKSLTLNGLYNPFEGRGILPRVASDLFHNIKTEALKNNLKICIQVSYVEFSRTTINDLLKSYPNHVYSLKDVIKVKVKTLEEALKMVFKGEGRKIYSETSAYPSHSASSIFTFYINTQNAEMQNNGRNKCKLHIIDLAGADTIGNFSCLFKNHHEVGAANLAKTQLEQFFLVLCSNIPEHIKVKQRLNPMIHYLGDSLNKTAILRLIGHIRVSREDLLVTISMLRFGELIGGLKAAKYEVNIDKEVDHERVDTLQRELAKLKLENKYNTILMQQDLAKSLNEERFAHIERTVNEFLQNKITQLTLLNVCDINIALEILKMICIKLEEEKAKEAASVPKLKRLSTSSNGHKVQQKTSRSSNKTTSSEKLVKKVPEKRPSLSAAADIKGPTNDKVQSLVETTRSKSKTSGSSLLRRSSLGRRKSSSNASVHDKSKPRSIDGMLMPTIPPQYNDAWNTYLNERGDEYAKIAGLYEKSETAAKNTYRTYLSELDKLRIITSGVEKHKNDLLMAKMTREFQQANRYEGGKMMLSDFEKCCMNELQRAEQEQLEKQETVLKCQSELKAYINICKEKKREVNDKFNAFCQDKFNAPVASLQSGEIAAMDIVTILNAEKDKIENAVVPENSEARFFERFTHLIDNEKRKKRLYQMKNREWLTY